MEKPRIDPDAAQQTLTIIWAALFVSQIMFFALVYFIKPGLYDFDFSRPFVDKNNFVFVLGSAVLSVSNILIGLKQSRSYLAQSVAEQNVGLVQTAMIIGCALSEAITLFGLLLAIAFDYQYFFVWFIIGLGSTLLHFPRRSYIDAATYKTL